MIDPAATAFFQKQQKEDEANRRCFDSGADVAEWASISHGIYLSIAACGVHRSLGVKVSFVQSLRLDAWKPEHLRIMELGGNRRFEDFMAQQGIPRDLPLRQKYRTRAAEWYRIHLRALAQGDPLPDPLPEGTGHLPMEEDDCDPETCNKLDEVFARPSTGCLTSRSIQESSAIARRFSDDDVFCVPAWVSKR